MNRVDIEDWGIDLPAPVIRRARIRDTLPRGQHDPGLDRISAELDALPDPGVLTAAQACSELFALQALQNRLDARRDALAAACDDAGYSWDLHAGNTGSFTAIASTANPGVGTATVRRGQDLRALPLVAAAYTAGRISRAHVDLILASIGRIDPYDELEQYLVDLACRFEPAGLKAALTTLILASLSEADAEKDYERSQRRRGIRLRAEGDGGVYVSGRLDAVQGRILHDALHPGMSADPIADDPRSADQKRADVLTNLLQAGMNATRPGGISSITVLVDLDDLQDGKHATYEDGTPIPASAFEQFSDQAVVFYLFGRRINAQFLPLSVAREKRYATTAQWKALVARDRGCIRCGATPRHTHAHHIRSWRDGGETTISNMCLLCSSCHSALHNGYFTITMTDGIPTITPTWPHAPPRVA